MLLQQTTLPSLKRKQVLLFISVIFIFAFFQNYAHASDRVALLIANEDYVRGDLANPINDAKLIEQKLSSLGFDVTVVENANRYKMLSAIQKFGEDSQGADSAVFYYSGHGMQDDYKQNFLLPTDANITGESSIRAYGVEAYEVINALKKAKPRISLVMFDACRDNPFVGVRGNRNFAVESYQTDSELLVSYATQTGQYAQDGVAGRNSPYAIALANQLEQATSVPLLKMFDNVKNEVKRQTNNQQSPTKMGDAEYDTYLVSANMSLATATRIPEKAQVTHIATISSNIYIDYNKDSDNDGVKDVYDQCTDSSIRDIVDENGCARQGKIAFSMEAMIEAIPK